MTGKVVDEQGPDVRLVMKNGSARVAKSDIEWIVQGTDKEIENGRRAAWYFDEAQKYFDRGKYDLAVVQYKKAIDLVPDDANLYNNMGCAYARLEIYADAAAAFLSALKRKPGNPLISMNLAQTYVKAGELRRAEHRLRRLVAVTRTEPDAYLLLGVVFYKRGRYTKSVEAYEKALMLSEPGSDRPEGTAEGPAGAYEKLVPPQDPKRRAAEVYNNLGASYAALRRFDDARRSYDRALELDPDLLSAKYNREMADKAEGGKV